MTEQEWRSLEGYVAKIAGILGLRDWKIDVKRDAPPDANNEAATWIANDADEAHIHVNDRFREWEADLQRAVITHELLHLHLDRLHDFGEQALRGAAAHAWPGLEENYRRLHERTTERLAQAISPLLPHIEWPEVIPEQSTD